MIFAFLDSAVVGSCSDCTFLLLAIPRCTSVAVFVLHRLAGPACDRDQICKQPLSIPKGMSQ